ncbi:MAG: hypothetical protein K9N23_09540 [Akkermansiaceae bacterium]|nr:hypothetical protein [Akkermansiaceae bacterium]MCF7731921.1 hypothetical protein [Akkermansiaceae bacterium]
MSKTKFLIGWSAAVGAMDTLTGLLLVVAPAATLGLLGIAPPSADALIFLSWIGVFVGAVGLSYGLVLINRRRGTTVWMFTALVRVLVGVFVVCQIAAENFSLQWVAVALTDLLVAGVQLTVLRARWWEEARR